MYFRHYSTWFWLHTALILSSWVTRLPFRVRISPLGIFSHTILPSSVARWRILQSSWISLPRVVAMQSRCRLQSVLKAVRESCSFRLWCSRWLRRWWARRCCQLWGLSRLRSGGRQLREGCSAYGESSFIAWPLEKFTKRTKEKK